MWYSIALLKSRVLLFSFLFTIELIKPHFAGHIKCIFKKPVSNSPQLSPIKFPVSISAELHARYSVRARARIFHVSCLSCCFHLLHRRGPGLSSIMFLVLPSPCAIQLPVFSLLLRKYTWGSRGGRDSLPELFDTSLITAFPRGDLTVGLKMGLI